MRGSEEGSARAAVIQAAYQATVSSVRLTGRKIPLRLRVCGRCTTRAVEVDEAAPDELDGGNEESSAGDGEAGTALGLGCTGDVAASATLGLGAA